MAFPSFGSSRSVSGGEMSDAEQRLSEEIQSMGSGIQIRTGSDPMMAMRLAKESMQYGMMVDQSLQARQRTLMADSARHLADEEYRKQKKDEEEATAALQTISNRVIKEGISPEQAESDAFAQNPSYAGNAKLKTMLTDWNKAYETPQERENRENAEVQRKYSGLTQMYGSKKAAAIAEFTANPEQLEQDIANLERQAATTTNETERKRIQSEVDLLKTEDGWNKRTHLIQSANDIRKARGQGELNTDAANRIYDAFWKNDMDIGDPVQWLAESGLDDDAIAFLGDATVFKEFIEDYGVDGNAARSAIESLGDPGDKAAVEAAKQRQLQGAATQADKELISKENMAKQILRRGQSEYRQKYAQKIALQQRSDALRKQWGASGSKAYKAVKDSIQEKIFDEESPAPISARDDVQTLLSEYARDTGLLRTSEVNDERAKIEAIQRNIEENSQRAFGEQKSLNIESINSIADPVERNRVINAIGEKLGVFLDDENLPAFPEYFTLTTSGRLRADEEETGFLGRKKGKKTSQLVDYHNDLSTFLDDRLDTVLNPNRPRTHKRVVTRDTDAQGRVVDKVQMWEMPVWEDYFDDVGEPEPNQTPIDTGAVGTPAIDLNAIRGRVAPPPTRQPASN